MAIVTIADENQTFRSEDEIAAVLAGHGIDYERWNPAHAVGDDAPAAEILRIYAREIERLKQRGGYVTADVIDIDPNTPGLDQMLAKFNREHWHDEDEVRFIIAGRGLFHIQSTAGPVLAIEVEAGARRRGSRHRNRSRSGRPHSRAARDVALVRSLRRPRHPRHSAVSGHGRVDTALQR